MTKEQIKNAKYISHTCEKLRESILFGKYEIESAILSCYHLSELASMNEIKKWTKDELEGYGKQDHKMVIDELPEYRKNIFSKVSKQVYDVNFGNPKPVYLPLGVSAPKITYMIQKNSENAIGFIINEQWSDILKSSYGLKNITNEEYIILIIKDTLVGILESIKVELISNINKLESYANKILEEIKDDEQIIEYDPKKIFIVHGRHEKSRNELEDILKNRLKLEPIVLMDQTNEGKTIIEKFENHSLNVGFVFVILTPDDIGMLKEDFLTVQSDLNKINDKLEDKARQNVILELGYFVGKLGRSRVCCIQQGDKELLPSDLHGLATIRFQNTIKETFLDIESELKKAKYLSNVN